MLQEEKLIRKGIVLDPKQDGVTHLNVYTGGNTVVGREVSNLFHAPTTTDREIYRPSDDAMIVIGSFDNLEGFWWWLSTGMTDDYFRTCNGFEARKRGSSMERAPLDSFKHEIRHAIAHKFRTYPEILKRFLNTTLPLTHYYVYGKNCPNPKIRPADRSMWVIKFLEEIRESQGKVLEKYLT